METKEGGVNKVRSHEGWRTPDESLLDMEAAKDGETFFVNMAFREEENSSDDKDVFKPTEE